MTDSIDLDDIAVEDERDEKPGNDGDWLWRDDAEAPESTPTGTGDESGRASDETASDSAGESAPGIPATTSDPVGVPGNAGKPAAEGGADAPEPGTTQGADTAETHGATEPDDMTMALTYKAAHHFTDPNFVFTDAHAWADWLGLVGDVSTPVIRKFQRENGIELDFFGGSEGGPASRLAEIDEESMFYAERMVLVGTDADEPVAEEAGWEFVHLEEAAEKAEWELRDDL